MSKARHTATVLFDLRVSLAMIRKTAGAYPLATAYFFPDFLIPCCPAFRGPFPFAFSAISLFAFASAFNFSRYAISSSSSSFFSFLGALRGLAFPPSLLFPPIFYFRRQYEVRVDDDLICLRWFVRVKRCFLGLEEEIGRAHV